MGMGDIYELLKNNSEKWFTYDMLTEELDISRGSLLRSVSRMATFKEIEIVKGKLNVRKKIYNSDERIAMIIRYNSNESRRNL